MWGGLDGKTQANAKPWQDEAGTFGGAGSGRIQTRRALSWAGHLDTVPNGGQYTALLGVMHTCHLDSCDEAAGIRLPFHLDVSPGFGRRRGTRFSSNICLAVAL